MKMSVWFVLVLLPCFFKPGSCDCQGDCVACGLLLKQQAFNTMVCLLECTGHMTSSLTWDLCKLEGTAGELDVTSLHADSEGPAPSSQEADQDERRFVRFDSSLMESSREEEEEEDEEEEEGQDDGNVASDRHRSSETVSLYKRFGGFQRGRHSYRKLIGSPARHLQKRYGGFIGVRKSARKWNSQKRVNQLLRQYLGMRSSRNFSPSARVWRHNKL
ncbi:prepronociceptin-like [Nerophis ophidion]|uniref:prepronociceptin-like n=1 Tax=Nerophis ophidion TaxID=159077 RepID=UPI002ADFDBFE|nr:prepronociceptin-like [Nerophis ophidion]